MRERRKGVLRVSRNLTPPPQSHLPCVAFWWHGSNSYSYFLEDWLGEAALIESEMKRFREWARNKVDELLRAHGSWAPAWEYGLVVCLNRYETRWVGASLYPRDRLVYSPEEGG